MKDRNLELDPKSFLYWVFNYVSALLFAYFLEEAVRFSAIFDLKFLAERINVNDPLVWDITYEICFLISFIIFHIIFSIAHKSRRKDFINDTKGLVLKKDGLVYHVKRYWINDIIVIILQVIIYLILFLSAKELCPVAIVYRLLGTPIGIIASLILLIGLQTNHILWSQYNWRVSHYMHE